MAFSTVLGLTMVAAAVVLFALLTPRRAQGISPILRSDSVEFALAVVFVLMLVLGAAFALIGFPTGINPAAGR